MQYCSELKSILTYCRLTKKKLLHLSAEKRFDRNLENQTAIIPTAT